MNKAFARVCEFLTKAFLLYKIKLITKKLLVINSDNALHLELTNFWFGFDFHFLNRVKNKTKN